MKNVVVMGSMEFFKSLKSNLSKDFTILEISKSRLDIISRDAQITLVYGLDFEKIICENALVLFDETFKSFIGKFEISNAVGAVLGKNVNAIAFLKNTRTPAITIGVSPKSTITYSGLQSDSVAVALQRTVKTIFGKEVDPFESPMPITYNQDIYQVLAEFFIKLEYDLL